jgi:hypothetical protein
MTQMKCCHPGCTAEGTFKIENDQWMCAEHITPSGLTAAHACRHRRPRSTTRPSTYVPIYPQRAWPRRCPSDGPGALDCGKRDRERRGRINR